MAHTIPFDTLKFARRLKDAGLPENQAEAISDAIREVQDAHMDDLATKRDLKEMEMALKRDMKEMELSMVIKMGAMILAGIGVLFGLMRAWPLPVQYVPASGQEMRYIPSTIPQPPAASPGK